MVSGLRYRSRSAPRWGCLVEMQPNPGERPGQVLLAGGWAPRVKPPSAGTPVIVAAGCYLADGLGAATMARRCRGRGGTPPRLAGSPCRAPRPCAGSIVLPRHRGLPRVFPHRQAARKPTVLFPCRAGAHPASRPARQRPPRLSPVCRVQPRSPVCQAEPPRRAPTDQAGSVAGHRLNAALPPRHPCGWAEYLAWQRYRRPRPPLAGCAEGFRVPHALDRPSRTRQPRRAPGSRGVARRRGRSDRLLRHGGPTPHRRWAPDHEPRPEPGRVPESLRNRW